MVKSGLVPDNFEKYVAKWCIFKDSEEKSTLIRKSRGGGQVNPVPPHDAHEWH